MTSVQLFKERLRHGSLTQPFEKGWKLPPGGGSDDTSQDKSGATDVDCASDRVDGKSGAALSDEQMGLL